MSHHLTRDHNTQNGARVREIFRRAKIYPGPAVKTKRKTRRGMVK